MKKKILLLSLLAIPFLNSCYYDNFEEIHPVITTCDTTGTITYTNDIAAILSKSCGSGDISCHKTGNPADIILDNYINTRDLATDGSLMGSINHAAGYKPMPKGGGFMDDCEAQHIQAWVNRGEPQ